MGYFLISQFILARIHTSDRVVSFKSEECSVYNEPLFLSYTVEILPYALRAKGFIVFNFIISLSLIFNQYVTSFLTPFAFCFRSYST